MTFQFKLLCIAIFVYAVTAYFSTGYLHADEHYQIIEFAGILDGSNTPDDLAWEFKAQIRPTFQPTIAYLIFESCKFFSITDPFILAFILRFITGMLAIAAIYLFSNTFASQIASHHRKWFFVLSYFLWFIPFLSVRYSSEIWSGIFFLIAFSLLFKNKNTVSTNLLVGLILGMSFICRFQIGFAIFGLTLWLIFVRQENIFRFLTIFLGFGFVALLGMLLDSWFYGQWTITFFNTIYTLFNYAEVRGFVGQTHDFGTSPWWDYVPLILKFSFFPIGIIILFSFFYLCIKKTKNPLVWIILPFLVGHSLIGHKELRFLFPLIFLLPALLFTSIDFFRHRTLRTLHRKMVNVTLAVLLIANGIGILVGAMKPAGIGRVEIMKNVTQLQETNNVVVCHLDKQNPFRPWGLSTHFYTNPNTKFRKLDFTKDPQFKSSEIIVLLILQSDIERPEVQDFIRQNQLKKYAQSIPSFLEPALRIYGFKMKNVWHMFTSKS